jgi:hypothetical protein
MDGWPVWLASLSFRDRFGKIVPTEKWSENVRREAERSIDVLLEGVGNPLMERQFRMCITMCRHRALSTRENEDLPQWWKDTPSIDLAGGPIEVLWHKGIPETLSTQPCRNPIKEPLSTPGTYLPLDCGKCDSCLAREACAPRYNAV